MFAICFKVDLIIPSLHRKCIFTESKPTINENKEIKDFMWTSQHEAHASFKPAENILDILSVYGIILSALLSRNCCEIVPHLT